MKNNLTIIIFIISAILIGIGVYPLFPPICPYLIDWLKTFKLSDICLIIGVIGVCSSVWYFLRIGINNP
jgi:hypothetical protein